MKADCMKLKRKQAAAEKGALAIEKDMEDNEIDGLVGHETIELALH